MPHKVATLRLLALLALLSSCKEDVVRPVETDIRLHNLSVSPETLRFTPSDGIRDTLVWFSFVVRVQSDDIESLEFGYTVRENGELLSFQQYAPGEAEVSGDELRGRFSISTSTIRNRDPQLNVFANAPDGAVDVLTRSIGIRGFATSPPQLLSVENPADVTLPAAGSKTIPFQAKAVHPVDQALMDGVFMWLVDGSGSRIPSDGTTFRLYDDGVNDPGSGRADLVAGDSLYTLVLSIGSQNSPDEYTVNWVARDQSGLSSDTLTSPLRILPAP